MKEFDDDEDSDEYDGTDTCTIDCPYCDEEVFDDAERCPACGNYLSSEDSENLQPKQRHFSNQPLWIIITALVLVYAMLHAYLWPLFIGVQPLFIGVQ